MAGINQGQPEVAVGEPIRFGDIDGFELEQHPVSDRLIIRDTENGTVAYVRAERGGQIGGDGVLIKALKESKPMADTGRTYDTIQQAEREASSWVFVPPGTYNENVEITTDGLTLQGSGYNTLIDSGDNTALIGNADNVTIKDISGQNNTDSSGNIVDFLNTDGLTMKNVTVRQSGNRGVVAGLNTTIVNCRIKNVSDISILPSENSIISNCVIESVDNFAINDISSSTVNQNNWIVANCIIKDSTDDGIRTDGDNIIIIGNRVINTTNIGIEAGTDSNNIIITNNRVSDSSQSDITDNGTGTLLDGNLTGASN